LDKFLRIARSCYVFAYNEMSMLSVSPPTTPFGTYWSVLAPKFALTISSLLFQAFSFLVDGSAKPMQVFYSLPKGTEKFSIYKY
jgi:hypothetical protein